MIVIKSEHELKLMREAGKVCAEIFKGLEDLIKPGISTKDIDDYVEAVTKKHGMRAAEKGYCGYPASVCTSVNDEVVHGIPSKKRKLQEGDIVSCDLVIENKGYCPSCGSFEKTVLSGKDFTIREITVPVT